MQPPSGRQTLLEILDHYEHFWNSAGFYPPDHSPEPATLQRFRSFLKRAERPFHRETQEGHITGSALVISPDRSHVLLMLHKKLGKWLQLGGHSDGDTETSAVALREAQEESGLNSLCLQAIGQESAPLPFDLDVHDIPARKDEPRHQHYDVRFLMQATKSIQLCPNEESHQLRWVNLLEARSLTQEPSMLRQFDKLSFLLGR